jgi:hypothetical protein
VGVESRLAGVRALDGWWGSGRAPHAPLAEQRAWAFGDPDATAGAAASQAGPVMAWRFSGQAAERVVFALGEAWASVEGNGSGRLLLEGRVCRRELGFPSQARPRPAP